MNREVEGLQFYLKRLCGRCFLVNCTREHLFCSANGCFCKSLKYLKYENIKYFRKIFKVQNLVL